MCEEGGTEMVHKRKEDGCVESAPRASMDYRYMSSEDEDATTSPIIVGANAATQEKYARLVDQQRGNVLAD